MTMNNPMQLIQMLKNGNPQQIAMNILQQRGGNNPMVNNIMQMIQSGDNSGIEQIARNLCKERGVDPDVMLNNVKTQFQ